MRLFIDTGSVAEVEEIAAWGILAGATTNPSLLAKEEGDPGEIIRRICDLVGGPVSAEVVSQDPEGMIAEGRALRELHEHVTVKVPFCKEGLAATHALTAEGIPVNMTLVFSANQALLAAGAGATYVSCFMGRLDDISVDSGQVVAEIVECFRAGGVTSQIIAASMRHPEHVIAAAQLGCEIATDPGQGAPPDARPSADHAGAERFRKPTGSRAPSSASGCGAGLQARRRDARLTSSRTERPAGRRGRDILAPAMAQKLDELHLADLHELAAELGVPRFRLLRRAELVSEIEARRGAGERAAERRRSRSPSRRARARAGAGAPERRAGRAQAGARARARSSTAATEEVTGVLEITPQRYGFLRLERARDEPRRRLHLGLPGAPLRAAPRRRGLRAGARAAPRRAPPRAGPRRRVNGGEPLDAERPEFDELTPILPKRRLAPRPRPVRRPHAGGRPAGAAGARPAGAGHGGPALGPHDAPARPRAGGRGRRGPELIVLLVDERPEEATAWREALPGRRDRDRHRRPRARRAGAGRRAGARAGAAAGRGGRRRRADRATRCRGSRSPPATLAEVKRLFGSGRDLAEEGAGSLTVIATVVDGRRGRRRGRARGDHDRELADPARPRAGRGRRRSRRSRAGECRVSNEEELREPEELAAARRLRSLLADLDPVEAAALLRERIEGSRVERRAARHRSRLAAGRRGEPRRARGRARSARRRARAGRSRRSGCRGRRRCRARPP